MPQIGHDARPDLTDLRVHRANVNRSSWRVRNQELWLGDDAHASRSRIHAKAFLFGLVMIVMMMRMIGHG
jgi:hypothetical protein